MLTNCPECNHKTSENAKFCQNCGHQLDLLPGVCQHCQGTGKNPIKYKKFLDPNFPQMRNAFFFSVAFFALIAMFVFAMDKPNRDFAMLIPIVALMLNLFVGSSIKKCPVCHGKGKFKRVRID